MTDAKNSEISFVVCTIYGILLHFTVFFRNFFCVLRGFVAKLFFAIYALLCGENLAKNSDRGEKMTNMSYVAKERVLSFLITSILHTSSGTSPPHLVQANSLQHSQFE